MKPKLFLLIFISSVILFSCSSQREKDRTVNISGAFALYPLVVQWSEEYQKEHPDIRFNISGGGAGKGLADALAGVVDLGMFSREITADEKQKGTWWVGLTTDAVIPSISSGNPYLNSLKKRGVTGEEFRKIFVEGTITNWNQLFPGTPDRAINIYTRSDACGAAETFAKYLGANQEELLGIGIFGDPGLAEVVANDPYGIGYNNTIYIYDAKTGLKRKGSEVIPIDINGNGKTDPEESVYDNFASVLRAISEGVYPSPPARELFFVAKGKPAKKATIDFIRWTLTGGQRFVQQAGYVPLESEKIQAYLKKLD